MSDHRWAILRGKLRATKVTVSIPWVDTLEDGSTQRKWSHLSFQSEPGHGIDRRRVKREVRKYVRAAMGRQLSSYELGMIMRRTTRAYA